VTSRKSWRRQYASLLRRQYNCHLWQYSLQQAVQLLGAQREQQGNYGHRQLQAHQSRHGVDQEGSSRHLIRVSKMLYSRVRTQVQSGGKQRRKQLQEGRSQRMGCRILYFSRPGWYCL
jgi:hypothetical protein